MDEPHQTVGLIKFLCTSWFRLSKLRLILAKEFLLFPEKQKPVDTLSSDVHHQFILSLVSLKATTAMV